VVYEQFKEPKPMNLSQTFMRVKLKETNWRQKIGKTRKNGAYRKFFNKNTKREFCKLLEHPLTFKTFLHSKRLCWTHSARRKKRKKQTQTRYSKPWCCPTSNKNKKLTWKRNKEMDQKMTRPSNCKVRP